MATPSDRKNPGPQDQPHDPHRPDDTHAIPEPPRPAHADDSSIDLGHPVEGFDPLNPGSHGSSSGISVVDWASLVEEVPADGSTDEEAAAFAALSEADVIFAAPDPIQSPAPSAPPTAPAEPAHHAEPPALPAPDVAAPMAMPAEAMVFPVEEEIPLAEIPELPAAPPAPHVAAEEAVFAIEEDIPLAEMPAPAPPPLPDETATMAMPAEAMVFPVEEEIPLAEMPDLPPAPPIPAEMEAPPALPADEAAFTEIEDDTAFLEASFAEAPVDATHEPVAEAVDFEEAAFAELSPSGNLRDAAQPPEIVEEVAEADFVDAAAPEASPDAVDFEAAAFAELSPSGIFRDAAPVSEAAVVEEEETTFIDEPLAPEMAAEAVDLEAAAFAELSPSGNLRDAAQPPEIVDEVAEADFAESVAPEASPETVDFEEAAFAELSPSGIFPDAAPVSDAAAVEEEAATFIDEPLAPEMAAEAVDLEAAAFAELSPSGNLRDAAQPPEIVEASAFDEAAVVSESPSGMAIPPVNFLEDKPHEAAAAPETPSEAPVAFEEEMTFADVNPVEPPAVPTPEMAAEAVDFEAAAFAELSPSGILHDAAPVSATPPAGVPPVDFLEDQPHEAAAPAPPSEVPFTIMEHTTFVDAGPAESPVPAAQPPGLPVSQIADSGVDVGSAVDLTAVFADLSPPGVSQEAPRASEPSSAVDIPPIQFLEDQPLETIAAPEVPSGMAPSQIPDSTVDVGSGLDLAATFGDIHEAAVGGDSPSGINIQPVDFLEDMPAETVSAEPPLSDIDLAAAAAFATPEIGQEETPFTPEALFAEGSLSDDETPTVAGPPPVPPMELDSGRKLHDVVELGADVVVSEDSGIDLSGVLSGGVEDSPIVAEVADEELDDQVETVDLKRAAQMRDEDVLELGADAVVAGSSGSISGVLAEVVESDSAMPPPVPVVEEGASDIDLSMLEAESPQPLAELEPPHSDGSLIVQAINAGLDDQVEIEAMEAVEEEKDAEKKPPTDKAKERTREVPSLRVPPPPPAEDDFFDAAELGVPVEGADVEIGAGHEASMLSAESSAIDLGSLPEMPTVPASGAAAGGDEVADIDLEALEAAASSSKRGLRGPSRKEEGKWAEDEFAGSAATVESPLADAGLEEVAIPDTGDLFEGDIPVSVDGEEGAAIETLEDTTPKKGGKKKKSKARGNTGALVGGSIGGALVGAGACVGLWFMFGRTPPVPVKPPLRTPPPAGAVSPDLLAKEGKYKEAIAALGDVGEKDTDKLAERGQLRWQAYARDNAVAGLKFEDPKVKEAVEDLKKAGTPEALFRLGTIYEYTGKLGDAKDVYNDGAAKCKEEDKPRFQNALLRLRLKAPAGAAGARLDRRLDDADAALLALVLVALQAPGGDKAAEPPEAGYNFYKALEAIRKNPDSYADAIALLRAAVADHLKRRPLRIGQQQNPNSDPNEDIFVFCAEELITAWEGRPKLRLLTQLQDQLVKEKVIDKPEDVGKGISKLLDERATTVTKITALEKQLDAVARAVGAKPEELDKVVKQLVDDNQLLQKEHKLVADAGKTLVDAKAIAKYEKPEDLSTGIVSLQNKLADSQKGVKDATEAFDQLAKDLTDNKYLDDKEKPTVPLIHKAVKNVIALANVKDSNGMIRDLQKKATTLETTIEKLTADQAAVVKKLNDDHAGEVKKLNDGFKAATAMMTTAHMTEVADLKKLIAATDKLALGLPLPDDPDSKLLAAFTISKRLDGALQVLNKTIEAAPAEEKTRLLAQRSLLRLEMAINKNAPLNDPVLKDAEADATAAGDIAAAHYAHGRIQEYLGRRNPAIESYTKAIELHKGDAATGLLYKAAKLRALNMPAIGPRPVPPDAKITRLPRDEDDPDGVALSAADEQRLALVLLTVLVQPMKTQEQIDKEKLAEEILSNKEAPFDAKADALQALGRWNEALKMYAGGLDKFLKPSSHKRLMELIEKNPALNRGSSQGNPLAAETFYGTGLRMYHARQYADAEKQFQAAVDNDDQDARYFYFLALAQLALNKNDYRQNMAEGAALERRARPGRVAVNDSLERVQGSVRRILDTERAKPPQP